MSMFCNVLKSKHRPPNGPPPSPSLATLEDYTASLCHPSSLQGLRLYLHGGEPARLTLHSSLHPLSFSSHASLARKPSGPSRSHTSRNLADLEPTTRPDGCWRATTAQPACTTEVRQSGKSATFKTSLNGTSGGQGDDLRHCSVPPLLAPAATVMPFRAVVVGAGIAGLGAAIALANQGHHVTILEATCELRPIGGTITLQANANRCLDHLGVYSELLRFRNRISNGPSTRRHKDGEVLAQKPAKAHESTFGYP